MLPEFGRATPHQVSIECFRDKLKPADARKLTWLGTKAPADQRAAAKPFWDAAVTGTAAALRKLYIAGWASANGKSQADFRTFEKPSMVSNWTKAAQAVLRLGVTAEHYLHVAVDTCPRNLRYPPIKWLGGDVLSEKVLSWKPPEERTALAEEKDRFDGMSWDELVARSERAGTL